MTDTDGMVKHLTGDWLDKAIDRFIDEMETERKIHGWPEHPKPKIADMPADEREVARKVFASFARAALTAIHPGLLDGTAVVVPREPTTAMLEAGWIEGVDDVDIEAVWHAFIKAAAHPNITPKPAGG